MSDHNAAASSSRQTLDAWAGSSSSNTHEQSRGRNAEEEEEELYNVRRYESVSTMSAFSFRGEALNFQYRQCLLKFTTVDWIVDGTRERARIARARLRRPKSNIPGSNAHLSTNKYSEELPLPALYRAPQWWPTHTFWGRRAWSFWLFCLQALEAAWDSGVVILVGVLIGINMAIISIATEWASDLKQGHCSAGWWLNQKFCCWELMDSAGQGGSSAPKVVSPATPATSSPSNSTATNATLAAHGLSAMMNLAARSVAAPSILAFGNSPPSPQLHQLYMRADGPDISEACSDWIPWSSWTLPAWFIYILFAVSYDGLTLLRILSPKADSIDQGCLAAAGAHLVRAFAPYAAGSGISEIKCILAGFVINGYLGAWTYVIKSLTLPLAIASGLSVGKEGPAVHVACAIGNLVAKLFKSFDQSQAKMRELLAAASAAGVAVAFGSPVGGVLFSLEFMNPFRTGKLVLFQVSYDRDWHYFEILFYIIIGIFGGLYGAFIIKYNLQVQSFRRSHLAAHGVSEVVVLAIITAVVCYFNKFLRIDMSESLEILFRECEGGGDYDSLCQSSAQWRMVNSLLLATIIRAVLVVVSYGCKVPAGIFVPSMAIGATFGRMVGILVKALYNAYPGWSLFSACHPDVPCITPGTYAFLGAAAALAGVTRITVAVVVIMFELTGTVTYILPTMIVVMVTKGIGDAYGKGGISEQTIKFQGYPFLDKEEHAFGISVDRVMSRHPVVLHSEGHSLKELEEKLKSGSYKGFPVVRNASDWTLLGYVGRRELAYAIGKARRARRLAQGTQCLFTVSRFGTGQNIRSSSNAGIERRGSTMTEDGSGVMNASAPAPEILLEPPSSGSVLSTFRGNFAAATGLGLPGGGGNSAGEEEAELLDEGDDALGGVNGEGDEDVLELGGWVDQFTLTVHPTMPLEVVMDLFKKMGPRVIQVASYGQLVGLVTVKDVLKHVAAEERAEAAARQAVYANSSNGSNASLDLSGNRHGQAGAGAGSSGAAGDFGIGHGELEILLNDLWKWASRMQAQLLPNGIVPRWVQGRFGPGVAGRSSTNAGGSRYSHLQESQQHQREYSVGEEADDDLEVEMERAHGGTGGHRDRSTEQEHFVVGEE
ncbi:glycerol ethanol, ferric requiring protein [Tilletia horrida]|uniref:Chloride channel protein n=1 Tax=Tilletia horrida TaxID=155126 RepID=A0AAN6GXW8_9BASI|nr:glycerol ethanol, ferric requiring protein [Tilletia horrida]